MGAQQMMEPFYADSSQQTGSLIFSTKQTGGLPEEERQHYRHNMSVLDNKINYLHAEIQQTLKKAMNKSKRSGLVGKISKQSERSKSAKKRRYREEEGYKRSAKK
jgi:hypothetical protein